MKIKPLGKRILIKVLEQEKKSKSGLILSSNIEETENYGLVVSVSKEIDEIKESDKVIFDKGKSVIVKKSGEVLYITNLEDIYAIVGDE